MDSSRQHRPAGPPPSLSDVLQLAMKAYSRFVLRLWIVSTIFCVGLTILKACQSSLSFTDSNGRSVPVDMNIQIKVLNTKSSQSPLYAIPALFGALPSPNMAVSLLNLGSVDACTPFKIDFEHEKWINSTLVDGSKANLSQKRMFYKRTKWFAFVNRGGCPFDVKAFEAQKAGFAGIIIFGNRSAHDFDETPIRMSPHNVGDQVRIHAMYMAHHDAQRLLDITLAMTDDPLGQRYPLLQLNPVQWSLYPDHSLLETLAVEMIILLVTVALSSTVVLSICFIVLLMRNLIFHRQLRLMQTLLDGSFVLLDMRQEEFVPKLSKIPFPERILTDEDVALLSAKNDDSERPWMCRDCCAICLDDFEPKMHVRILPCRHVFHSTCVDPWLLQHNRLCPICKRDVLAGTETLETSVIAVQAADPEESRQVAQRPHSLVFTRWNILQQNMTRWIERQLGNQRPSRSETNLFADTV